MTDYNRMPVGMLDIMQSPPVTFWTRFDSFMWHVEPMLAFLARVAAVAIAIRWADS